MGRVADGGDAARRILITGLPCSGKSTVGRLIAAGIDRSVYIDADLVRESIVGGFVPPDLPFTDEFIDQTRLQREIVNLWVERMVAAGFTAVIDDAPIPQPPHFARQYAQLTQQASTIQVVLRPTAAELRQRLVGRGGPFDDFFLTRLDEVLDAFDMHDFSDWTAIDNTGQSPNLTAESILSML